MQAVTESMFEDDPSAAVNDADGVFDAMKNGDVKPGKTGKSIYPISCVCLRS